MLTKGEIEFLRESNAIEREYRDVALEDAKKAWLLAKRYSGNIDFEFILQIHRQLMKTINSRIAGNIRQRSVWVGDRKCLDYNYIRQELDKLCHEWNILRIPINSKKIWKEILVMNWHIRFEKIHPFVDGNGRTGRIIMNKQRMRIGLPIKIIHTGKEQMEYYRWFEE